MSSAGEGDPEVRAQLDAALGPEYKVERELGEGGFAVVYLVRDLKLRRPLAVKVLVASKAGPVTPPSRSEPARRNRISICSTSCCAGPPPFDSPMANAG